jgi:TonB family protein
MHGLGMGLDEKALEAVNQWQFKPAMAGGQPVKVAQSAEVEFRLFVVSWRLRRAAYQVISGPHLGQVISKTVLTEYTSPNAAACPGDGGAAIVDFQIGEDGLPRDVRPRLTDGAAGLAAAKAIESWRFQPGSANGEPRGANAWIEFACGPPIAVGSIYRVGNGVTSPVPIYRPEPDYSEEARKGKVEGAVTVQVVIDPSGHATQMKIVHGLVLGLDEKAMEAVALWRFKPATMRGKPVAALAQIQVNFRLL